MTARATRVADAQQKMDAALNALSDLEENDLTLPGMQQLCDSILEIYSLTVARIALAGGTPPSTDEEDASLAE